MGRARTVGREAKRPRRAAGVPPARRAWFGRCLSIAQAFGVRNLVSAWGKAMSPLCGQNRRSTGAVQRPLSAVRNMRIKQVNAFLLAEIGKVAIRTNSNQTSQCI